MGRSLYEMLEVHEEIKPFVNDFKLNLFDYHDWKDFSRFKTAKSVNELLYLLGLPEQSVLTYLSSLKYESAICNSMFYFIERNRQSECDIRFVNHPHLNGDKGREIRKLMSMGEGEYALAVFA